MRVTGPACTGMVHKVVVVKTPISRNTGQRVLQSRYRKVELVAGCWADVLESGQWLVFLRHRILINPEHGIARAVKRLCEGRLSSRLRVVDYYSDVLELGY